MKQFFVILFTSFFCGTSIAQVPDDIFSNNHTYKSNYPAFIFPFFDRLHGTVVEVTEDVYTADVENNQPVNKRKGSMDRKVTSVLDDQRRLLLETTYNDQNSLLRSVNYVYKENQLQKITKVEHAFDTLLNKKHTDTTNTFFYYNDKLELIQESQFINSTVNNDGWSNKYAKNNFYTPEGRLAYTNENTIGSVAVYSYDEQGNCTSIFFYELDHERLQRVMPPILKLELKYNELNQRIVEDYKYSNSFHAKKFLAWTSDSLLTSYITVEKYAENPDDSMNFKLYYNERGNKIKCEYSSKEFKQFDETTYQYDDHNNWIYCANKSCDYFMIIERKIVYK